MAVTDYPVKHTVPETKISQHSYTPVAKAHKQIPVLAIPTNVIADATTAQLIGLGTLLRVSGTAGGYITFGTAGVSVPGVATANAIQTAAEFFYVVSTSSYVRTSAAMRIEVIEE